jgi:phage terminase large subunit
MYDESYYKIYALGEKGTGKTTIYTHWKHYEHLPEIKETYYGLDFGFNHPTALIEVNIIDNTCYVKEIIYKEGLTSTDLIKMMDELQISKKKEIACDTARPEIIEDLRRKGYNAKSAIKDVKDGKYLEVIYDTASFIYPPSIEMSPHDLDQWVLETIQNLSSNPLYKDYVLDKVIYWRIGTNKSVTIYRDDKWFDENKPILKKHWKQVEYFRNNQEKTNN